MPSSMGSWYLKPTPSTGIRWVVVRRERDERKRRKRVVIGAILMRVNGYGTWTIVHCHWVPFIRPEEAVVAWVWSIVLPMLWATWLKVLLPLLILIGKMMSGKLVSDWSKKKKGLGLGAVIRKAFCVHIHTLQSWTRKGNCINTTPGPNDWRCNMRSRQSRKGMLSVTFELSFL